MEQGTIQFQQIFNIETSFKRALDLDFENYPKSEPIFHVGSTVQDYEGKDEFVVLVNITLKYIYENKTLIDILVHSGGMFKKNKPVDEPTFKNFCGINAPAIIFPFIRETISSLSVKAGLQPILIQPINFVELHQKNQSENQAENPKLDN